MPDVPLPPPRSNASDPLTDGTYIRTYAKDVAKLTGKPVLKGPVVVAKQDLSPAKKPKTLEEELTPSDEALAAMPTNALSGVAMRPAASPAVRGEGRQEEEIQAARSEILARLKAQGNIEVAPAPPPPPSPAAPTTLRETPPAPPPGPSPLHTYKTDFADRIDTKKASTFSVLAAQSDAGRVKPKPLPSRKPFPVGILVGAVLVIGGIAGVFFAFKFVTTAPAVPQEAAVPSLIFSDERLEVHGTGADLVEAVHDAASQPLAANSVRVLYVTTSSTSPSGTFSLPLPGGSLIAMMNLAAPDILLRNIGQSSTVGVIHAGDQTAPFFVLNVSSYERTFAGMLSWEPTLRSSLAVLYPSYPATGFADTQAATTSSSTPPAPPPAPTGFVDRVVANHDTRILYDAAGRSLVLYGYRDKQTLIIARDPAAFTAILERLAATKSN